MQDQPIEPRRKRRTTGIEARHSRSCRSRDGGKCNCQPSWRAFVYDRRTGGKIRKTFATETEAKAWRAEATTAVGQGRMRAPTKVTLREAANEWLAGARSGAIRNRSGDRYKPSAVRGYSAALRDRILPDLGALRLSEVRRPHVQDLADRLLAEGLNPSTIRNALMPLRAIYRRAVARGEVAVNPTTRLELPAVRGRRDRIASPGEAARLITAVPGGDRAIWATAFYAGLRRGELMALRWEDVDLANGIIRVQRGWDMREGVIDTKSRAGRRRMPVVGVLRDHLLDHKLRTNRESGLVFGRSETVPFEAWSVRDRANKAWAAWRDEHGSEARLTPISLHEARHTAASVFIAAGVNAKALTTYMGHGSIAITFDRYGHLMPGNEAEAAALVDDYLERADTSGRLSQLDE